MGTVSIVLLIIVAVIAVLVIWVIAAYNGFVRLRNMVEEAFSTMDVYLKKRYDLIPNLVETVKGYAAHESGTLEKVVQARNMAASATTIEGKIQGENALQGTLKSLFAIAEAYPDLKANTNFLDLQAQLQRIEDEIANSRKYYNAIVKEFNTKTEVFPSNIVAGIFNFRRKTLFEVNDEREREAVRVAF
ncbi:LemA family protein [Sinanaerobacter chloroacetimidivorans]|jgi:LemA protein|uniref:LemA family protein n=1 Tax=Sinanaerobacter chloroacetimidivorans TaxID=2818044 RepID=A0A8J7W0X1_9FIRM|nr:LemA family protein [Sinanaerobacter chloroacetimidivorans]MBR0598769.1 LemA family protein [Sinanaerobacter chloroacetimidivorans]